MTFPRELGPGASPGPLPDIAAATKGEVEALIARVPPAQLRQLDAQAQAKGYGTFRRFLEARAQAKYEYATNATNAASRLALPRGSGTPGPGFIEGKVLSDHITAPVGQGPVAALKAGNNMGQIPEQLALPRGGPLPGAPTPPVDPASLLGAGSDLAGAASTASTGRAAGLLGRLGLAAEVPASTTRIGGLLTLGGKGAAGRTLARAGFGNATAGGTLGAGLASSLAGHAADSLDLGGKNSTVDQFATGAAGGGAFGGVITKNPIGALIGAGVGGVGNVAYNKFFGKKNETPGTLVSSLDDATAKLDQYAAAYELDDETRQKLQSQLALQGRLLAVQPGDTFIGPDGKKVKKVDALDSTFKALLSSIPALQEQATVNKQTEQSRLAAQARIASLLEPELKDISYYYNLAADKYTQAGDPAFAELVRGHGSRAAGALKSVLTSYPGAAAQQREIERRNQLDAILQSAQLQSIAQSILGTGQSSSSLADIAAGK